MTSASSHIGASATHSPYGSWIEEPPQKSRPGSSPTRFTKTTKHSSMRA